ncbi:hypothetical protein PR202_ga20850 [Eleusine coracana subsp. coracana]|uniref:DUF4408 domain-containing protein n=1 Tax=Eleusine coracana subsp. coracana TaxID=191504 RepID=A0AAV5CZD6_ELECO|nr:hypothetical protein QOZ80_8AG0629090 [Eleusine coracana subsp. coracana]GJN03409.1 hypothetical protein PR202_ga20850 [Eleusine coracana subsp. coracana]
MVVVMAQLWWSLSPWLSPSAAWFVFFNAVVAAIAVMSSCAQQQEQDGHVPASSRRRLCRSASSVVLDQLRSFSIFSIHPTTAGGVTVPQLDDDPAGILDDSEYYHCSQEAAPHQVNVNQVSKVVSEAPMLMVPVSAEESVPMTAAAVVPRASVVAAAAAVECMSGPVSKDEEPEAAEEERKESQKTEQDESISLDEAYANAMVQRQSRRPWQSPLTTAATVATNTVASWPQKTNDLAAQSPIKRRHRREPEEALEGKAELNARAELFIRQFREELKLQRLNSLIRHTHAFGALDGTPMAVR